VFRPLVEKTYVDVPESRLGMPWIGVVTVTGGGLGRPPFQDPLGWAARQRLDPGALRINTLHTR
jgi:hypothetical protein